MFSSIITPSNTVVNNFKIKIFCTNIESAEKKRKLHSRKKSKRRRILSETGAKSGECIPPRKVVGGDFVQSTKSEDIFKEEYMRSVPRGTFPRGKRGF